MLSHEYTPPSRPSSVATARRIYGQSPPRSASPSSSRRRRKPNSGSQSARSSSRSHLNRWLQYTRAVSPDRSFVMPRDDPMLSTARPHKLDYDVGIDHREYALLGTELLLMVALALMLELRVAFKLKVTFRRQTKGSQIQRKMRIKLDGLGDR